MTQMNTDGNVMGLETYATKETELYKEFLFFFLYLLSNLSRAEDLRLSTI